MAQTLKMDDFYFDCTQDETLATMTHDATLKFSDLKESDPDLTGPTLDESDAFTFASSPVLPKALVSQAAEDLRDKGSSSRFDDALDSFDNIEVNLDMREACLDQFFLALDMEIDFTSMLPTGANCFDDPLHPFSSGDSLPWEQHALAVPEASLLRIDANNLDVTTPTLTEGSTPTSLLPLDDLPGLAKVANSSFDTDNQRWHATQLRFRAADRSFLYGVLTTKIFCRPSCASRRPSRRHIRFFPFPGAIEAAEQANFRACKRCKPNALGVTNTGVLGICEVLRLIIAEAFGTPSADGKDTMKLESLAKSAGLSTFHFHRLFKATTQVTPGDFIHACRSLALQDALGTDKAQDSGKDVDAAVLVEESWCWSVRSARKALGGMLPTDYAKGATCANIQYCYIDTPCGGTCAVYSMDKSAEVVRLHAVLLGQDAEVRAFLRFPFVETSTAYGELLHRVVSELGEEGRDRDTEITADVLPVLWRARIWLKLVQCWGK